MNRDNQNEEHIKELKENGAEISEEDLEGVTGGVNGFVGVGHVPIPDTTCKGCEHMQCVLCGKQVNSTYYINHACLHNELVPNTCGICKYRMTIAFDSDGNPFSVCRFGNEQVNK